MLSDYIRADATESDVNSARDDLGVAIVVGGAAVRLAATAPLSLMQPTTLCNLDCSYCYLPDRGRG
jgi:sulfatase maturation enzyme AslB (radical SAM superfamily)